MSKKYSEIEYTLTDSLAEISLNRPKQLNAINVKTLDEASEATDVALANGARALLSKVGRQNL